LETPKARILIDAGISGLQIRKRLESVGGRLDQIDGIIITHDHDDHVSGLRGALAKFDIPVYCNRLTREVIESKLKDKKIDGRIFTSGQSFDIGDIHITSFTVPHDASDPVNFFIQTPGGNLGFLTDLGHATKLALERVRASNVLVMESNHDVKMLMDDSRRPWQLKQRILSRHGHLSNESAADAVEQIVSAELRHLYLGHISRDCNRPEIARAVMTRRIEKIGAQHVQIEVAAQDVPCPTLLFPAPAQPGLGLD
jgi:phosphoribosyl 1,2-cyclic phosphodiesterase